MIELNPLCTMTVRLKEPLDAGNAPTGRRVIAEIASASLAGRLRGSLAGGLIAGSFGGWRAVRLRPAAALARVV